MNKITDLTKESIVDLIIHGIDVSALVDSRIWYPYYGRIDQTSFLKRIFNLDEMEIGDKRCESVADEIFLHTEINDDWPPEWIFEDDRFYCLQSDDGMFLNFLVEIFHPEVRDENGYWSDLLNKLNELLIADGFEIYPNGEISGRKIYNWRVKDASKNNFVPFSIRNKRLIEENEFKISLSMDFRYRINTLIKRNDESEYTNQNGFEICKDFSEKAFEMLEDYYIPRSYHSGIYSPSENLKEFIESTSPLNVLDAIEAFILLKSNDKDLIEKINLFFKTEGYPLYLDYAGKVISDVDKLYSLGSEISIKEVGISELIQLSQSAYHSGMLPLAVEKLWDAFERTKTIYEDLKKRRSAEKIIDDMSGDSEILKNSFNDEFNALTYLGNNLNIRHHETSVEKIKDDRHYRYLYRRLFSLLSLVLEYI